ncbi:multifunctional 2',3'-cyclic-nucleotide 2'-phosphodiesterase/5'-nucleotidase/3'-nucleotidase [Clostridiales bacterium COT073_COT-073]|nr:multifunctional 2',3'-cyclic-nucleotide 2'-phosphodiesterase/5'-nucleotidase/3'-nucleotidase [Clostridiales bacterium COT073_COT-073]
MVLKAIGYSQAEASKEENVKLNTFTDVPEWFKGYAGLAKDLKITTGKTDEVFDPEAKLSKHDFLTFLLRALKHNSKKAWENADALAKEFGLVAADTDIETPITKREAAAVVLNALNAPMQAGVANQTLGQFLVYREVISKEKAKELGLKELAQPENKVDILYFNDFHGNLREEVTDKKRNIGMSKLVGFVNEYVAQNPNSFVLSGGDNYQGTAESNLTYGKPVTAMMKGMNVLASAVGNHEFDWGWERIGKWAEDGNFTYLAANIWDVKADKLASWVKPYMFVEKGGIKIALIGLAHPDTPTLTNRSTTEGYKFLDPIKTAQEWVDYLQAGKAKEGKPDVIIALTHIDSDQDKKTNEISGPATELANKVKGLDGILSAHSHRPVSGKVNGVEIMQAYYAGRTVGIMTVEKKDGKFVLSSKLNQGSDIKDVILKDNETEKFYSALDKELKPILGEVIGKATEEFTHDRSVKGNITTLGQWVCEVSAAKYDAQISIQNGGGLRRTLEKGDITMGDMYEIMPFDNYFVVMDLPGEDLKKAIDHGIINPKITDGSFSGLLVEYDSTKEFENRITKITLSDGTPLDMKKTYRVVINDFIFNNGDEYDFKNATNVNETYIPIRDFLVEVIKEQKEITPKSIDGILKDINKTSLVLDPAA